jgi:hypothetical protein
MLAHGSREYREIAVVGGGREGPCTKLLREQASKHKLRADEWMPHGNIAPPESACCEPQGFPLSALPKAVRLNEFMQRSAINRIPILLRAQVRLGEGHKVGGHGEGGGRSQMDPDGSSCHPVCLSSRTAAPLVPIPSKPPLHLPSIASHLQVFADRLFDARVVAVLCARRPQHVRHQAACVARGGILCIVQQPADVLGPLVVCGETGGGREERIKRSGQGKWG